MSSRRPDRPHGLHHLAGALTNLPALHLAGAGICQRPSLQQKNSQARPLEIAATGPLSSSQKVMLFAAQAACLFQRGV